MANGRRDATRARPLKAKWAYDENSNAFGVVRFFFNFVTAMRNCAGGGAVNR